MSSKILIGCVFVLCCIGCAEDEESTQATQDMGQSVSMDGGVSIDSMMATSDAEGILADMDTPSSDAMVTPDAMQVELTPVPQAEASTQLANAVCEFSERCQLLELLELVVNEPCGDFIQNQFEDGTLAALETALSAGSVNYDDMKMAGCIAQLSDAQCDVDLESLFSTCDTAFVGQVPQGEPCEYNQVCEDDLVCVFSDACPGQCALPPATGEACTASTGCSEGSVCHNQTCAVPVSRSATCTENGVPCASGLFCKGSLFGTFSCEPLNTNPVGRGQTCDLNGGPFCTSGLSCVAQPAAISIPGLPAIPEFKCLEKVSADQACFAGAPDQCPAGYFCDGFDLEDLENLDIEGTCIALPNEGEACASSLVGEVCNTGLVCSAGQCAPRVRIDGTCTSDAACYSGACVSDACTTPLDAACRQE